MPVTSVTLEIDGVDFEAQVDESASGVIVPCVECDDCHGKQLAKSRGALGPFEKCFGPGRCVKGHVTPSEVVYQKHVVTNHFVCATHFPLPPKIKAVFGVRDIKRSYCFGENTTLDVTVESPCEVEWHKLTTNKAPLVHFNTLVEGESSDVFLMMTSPRTYAPYAAKRRCQDVLMFDELDVAVPCDSLGVENAYMLGMDSLRGKRVFFDDGYVGFSTDADCSGRSLPIPSASPSHHHRLRVSTTTHRKNDNDYSGVIAFCLVLALAFGYELWQNARWRRYAA